MHIVKVAIVSFVSLLMVACGGASKKLTEAELKGGIPPEKAYQYAQRALKTKDYDQALPLLEIAAKQPNVDAEQLANLGVALSRTGEYEQAVSLFNRSLKLAPDNADILVEQALAYRELGQFDQAKKIYRQALISNPQHQMANYNLGILCDLYKEDLDCAIRHYQQYLAAFGQEDKTVNIWLKDLAKRKQKALGGAK